MPEQAVQDTGVVEAAATVPQAVEAAGIEAPSIAPDHEAPPKPDPVKVEPPKIEASRIEVPKFEAKAETKSELKSEPKPGKLIVLKADTGQTIAALAAPERTDEVVWDRDNRRIYVAGGQGYISVVQQDGPDRYREIAKVASLPGAKTEILDRVGKRLWVAASPGETKAMAKVLRFDISPR